MSCEWREAYELRINYALIIQSKNGDRKYVQKDILQTKYFIKKKIDR